MNPNILGAEAMNIVPAIIPVNLATGANVGDWVSMKNYHRCTVVIFAAAGTNGSDLTSVMEQATDVAGSGPAKALNFTRIDIKQAVSMLTGPGAWTTVEFAATNSYVNTDNGESQMVYAIDFLGEDLDTDNGFDCLRLTVNQVGAAKIGGAFYIMREPRNGSDAQGLASAIIN